MKIIQIAESIMDGDGMGNHIILTHQALKKAGYQVETYCTNMDGSSKKIPISRLKENIRINSEDVVLYQYGITGYCAQIIEKLPGRKILCYHNITTPALVRNFEPEAAEKLERSYDDIRRWANTDLLEAVIAMSEYNRQDLIAMGYPREKIHLSDYLIPFEDYAVKPDAKTVEKYADGCTNILFVGRIAPNKKQEDLIRGFAQYQKDFDPTARLLLVGSGLESRYGESLQKYTSALNVPNVTFCGKLSFPQIIAMYHTATVFLCMSEHEGFCIPLMEAMHFQVPVIAYGCAAVPDTMSGAGVTLPTKHPVVVANWIHKLVTNQALRKEILAQQNTAVQYHGLDETRSRNLATFRRVVDKQLPPDSLVLDMADRSGAAINGKLYDIVNRHYKTKGFSLPFTKAEYLTEAHQVPGMHVASQKSRKEGKPNDR